MQTAVGSHIWQNDIQETAEVLQSLQCNDTASDNVPTWWKLLKIIYRKHKGRKNKQICAGINTMTDLLFAFLHSPLPSCFDFSVVKSLWILQHENESGRRGRLTLRGKRNLCRSHLFWVLQTNPFATQSDQKGEMLLIAMFQGKGKET